MGWSSGTSVMSEIMDGIMEVLPDDLEKRKALYKRIIKTLCDHDWDDEGARGGEDPAYDEALKELYPNWYGDL